MADDSITILVRTLKKEEFSFTVNPNDQVLSLKQKIEQQLKHEVAAQKLIFTGKILADTQTFAEAGVQNGNFLVLLPTARKPGAPAPAAAAPAAAAPTPAAAPAVAAAPAPAPAPANTGPQPVSDDVATPAIPPDNELVTGSDYEKKVQELVDMGFERSRVVLAMEAAFNNVSRAADYLLTEIPTRPPGAAPGGGLRTAPASPPIGGGGGGGGGGVAAGLPTSPPSPQADGGSGSLWDMAATEASGGGGGGGGGSGALDFLRNLPYFNQIRLAVQSSPNMLPLILQNLAQTQPQVLQLIQQHQQEFIDLLSEPVPPGAAAGGLPGLPGGPGGPQVVHIQLTPAEAQSVQNLIALGFSRNRVLQAFLACDRDENAAANFLFENAAEDDEDVVGGDGSAAGGDSGAGLEDDISDDDFF